MDLIFWHNIISPHQAPFMRELAETGHNVTVVSTEVMSKDRCELGWNAPSLGPAHVIIGPDQARVTQIVTSSEPDAIHFIAGARGTILGRQAAFACRAAKRRMGMITEAPDMRGVRGLLRWCKYLSERLTLGLRFDFILAMGEKGQRWFRLFGYPSDRIFPFAYVTEKSDHGIHKEDMGSTVRILYGGQMITRKGVDVLLRALADIKMCELSLIGNGPENEALHLLADQLGMAHRICWLGQIPATQIPARMATADFFVLPSREDGWGAVVNESLMSGTPVICSNACGAAELIRHPWLGTVFRSGDVLDLTKALRGWASKGKRQTEERDQIREWAQCIEAPAVAGYIEAIMKHIYDGGPRPEAPWRKISP